MDASEDVVKPKVKKIRLRPTKRLGRPPKHGREERVQSAPADPLRSLVQSRKAKERYKDPEQRRKTAEQLAVARAGRKTEPAKFSRLGVPDGWSRKEAELQRQYDSAKADIIIQHMTDTGMIDPTQDADFEVLTVTVDGKPVEVRIPKTDEGKAALALREAVIAAISPLTHAKNKMAAVRTVLEWTKAKPAQTINSNVNAEDWLAKALQDNSSTDANGQGASSAP